MKKGLLGILGLFLLTSCQTQNPNKPKYTSENYQYVSIIYTGNIIQDYYLVEATLYMTTKMAEIEAKSIFHEKKPNFHFYLSLDRVVFSNNLGN